MARATGLSEEDRYLKCVVIEPPTGSTPILGPGQTLRLANLAGAGTVDLIQLGVGPIVPSRLGVAGARTLLDSRLQISIDGAPPLVTDLGMFFVAHGESDPWACDRLGVTGLDHVLWEKGASYFRRVMIPYRIGCVIELVNASPVASALVFSQIYFYEGVTPARLTGSRRRRFGWQWTRFTKVAPFHTLNLLDITGRGVVDGIQLFTAGPIPPDECPSTFRPRWLEGDPAFTIDGGLGNWHAGGTEDFFGTQGYGEGLHQTTDSWGMPTRKPIGGGSQFCVTMYRFFDRDPVIFNESCKFTFANGQEHQADDVDPPEIDVAALVSYYIDPPVPPTQ